MAQQKGATSTVTIGFEATAGTVATDGFVMPINSCNIKPSQAVNKANTISSSRSPVQPFRGNKSVEGTIVVPLDSVAMWYWVKAILGAPTTSGAGPYVHEYKIGASVPSLTIEEGFTDLTTDKFYRYLGCKVTSLDIGFGGDGELIATIGIMGMSYSVETTAFDATPTAITISRTSNFQAALLEGGSSFAYATAVNLKLDNGLDGDTYVIGSNGTRGSINEGVCEVSGSLDMLYNDNAEAVLAKGLAATESSLKVTCTAAATSIFEVEVQELEYGVSGPEIPGPQGLKASLPFQGFYTNGSEASALVVRITNSEAHA
jgi:hypothetical protein